MRSRATIYHLAGRTAAAAAEAALAIDWLGREGKQGRGGDTRVIPLLQLTAAHANFKCRQMDFRSFAPQKLFVDDAFAFCLLLLLLLLLLIEEFDSQSWKLAQNAFKCDEAAKLLSLPPLLLLAFPQHFDELLMSLITAKASPASASSFKCSYLSVSISVSVSQWNS